MRKEISIGEKVRGKKVLDIKELSNGWVLLKTENGKSKKDFLVKLRNDIHIAYTIKHAHFAIDLFGKFARNRKKAKNVFDAIVKMWQGNDIQKVLKKYEKEANGLPGYKLEYILYALKWILDQEDINFGGRPKKKQDEFDEVFKKFSIKKPKNRKGSEITIALLADIINDVHPVEAFYQVNIKI